MRSSLIATLTVVLAAAGTVRAAPFDASQVAGDAKWVAHIDVDAAMKTTIMQTVRQRLIAHEDVQKHINEVKAVSGMDLWSDLHGITFYGSDFDHENGVAVISAKVDPKRVVDHLRLQPDYKVEQHGKRQLHYWTKSKGPRSPHGLVGAFHTPSLMVVSRDEQKVHQALAALDGKASTLKGSTSPLAAAQPAGACIHIKSLGTADAADLKPKQQWMRQARSVSIAMGERAGQSFLSMAVNATTPEAAQQMKQIVDGFKAMAAMKHASDPDVKRLLDAVQLTLTDSTVAMNVELPSNELIQMMEKHWNERGGRGHHKRGHDHDDHDDHDGDEESE